ncbi:chemotaxis protein CheW [Enterovibrio sp. ZSDZ35]|uniref:Chemotaxis protein CheW n=1 Tax=Enterovibrio qingdaonensis TaxID=2899818 RepID=A0ABT5QQE7_9GAMM|nr:chemotaxis protein CheW [Enterovibrio sp. ZSDZ35]MDD1783205.1 chemotaxis protein CheW [Enterovibrio sp. ZSDZ35]
MSMAAEHQTKFQPPSSASASEGSASKRFNQKNLIFSLDNEQYGIPLSSVKEVIGMVNVTPIPHVPLFFKGLLNLRGKIISVIDLRLKLGLKEKPYEAKKTSIIISDVNELTIGTIVDDVNEVVGFNEEQIEKNLDISNSIKRDYIAGVAKGPHNLVLLLDIHRVLDPDELDLINQHAVLPQEDTNKESQEG